MSTQLLVAGFHRSGTSLTAQILHHCGLFLGERLMGAHSTNPHGHFEDEEIVELHDEILADNGLTWQVTGPPPPVVDESRRSQMREIIQRRQAGHEVWGFKDPRVCLFLNTWKELLPEARVLVVYRSFVEVISSLHKRHTDGILQQRGRQDLHRRFWEERDLALRMWLTHNRALLGFARAYREDVMVVSFEMLRQGFPLIGALNERWSIGLSESPEADLFDPSLAPRADIRHPVSNEEIIGEALDTWEALERLSRQTKELTGTSIGGDSTVGRESLYRPANAYGLKMENEFLDSRASFLQGRVEEAERALEGARAQLEEVEGRLEEAEKNAISPQRRKELEKAETDLNLIISRMSRSRLSPFFRLKEEFRELEDKYYE